MTEELKQKGIKYACEYPSSQDLGYGRLGYKRVDLRKAYIAGATENTELLSKHIVELQADKGRLTDKLTEAKEIIRELLDSCFGYNSKTVNYEAKAKAEAFLKE